jgi:gamma-glutamyltranspeptidase / glutathione hydrolase
VTVARGSNAGRAQRWAWPPFAAAWALALVLVLVLAACTQVPPPGPIDDDDGDPTGPVVVQIGDAAVVSAHPLATQAGVDVLAAGGSAADAAVAIAAMLSVVEPWFSSALGGGTWALYYDANTRRVTSLDGVGPIGGAATVATFEPRAGEWGMHQANVPGAWDGWMLWLDRYGRLELGDLLAPAIAVAREGYVVGPDMAAWLGVAQSSVINATDRPDTAAIYRPGGTLLGLGDTVHQFDMADTFESLVASYDAARPLGRGAAIQAARDHYYRGPIAEAIVAFSDAQPGDRRGDLRLSDFAGFAAAIRDPVHVDMGGGVTVYQNPPNSQGITMLIALNVLAGFDYGGWTPDDPAAIHLQLEALKLAFEQRHTFVGDPDCVPGGVDVQALLSSERAAELRARIALDRVLVWDPVAGGLVATEPAAAAMPATATAAASGVAVEDDQITGTTTFHVLDHDGNAAAVTTSLGAQFYVVGSTGIHINNRMRFIGLAEGDPNRLQAGCKVRHTSNPYMVLLGGRPYLLGGNTGADSQVQGQLQQLMHVLASGLGAAEAVARPRFLTTAFPATTYPYAFRNTVQLQTGFEAGVADALRAMGHTVSVGQGVFGVAHMLELDAAGDVVGLGIDPRYATSSGQVLQGD